jgi:hypothetical protein
MLVAFICTYCLTYRQAIELGKFEIEEHHRRPVMHISSCILAASDQIIQDFSTVACANQRIINSCLTECHHSEFGIIIIVLDQEGGLFVNCHCLSPRVKKKCSSLIDSRFSTRTFCTRPPKLSAARERPSHRSHYSVHMLIAPESTVVQ